MRRDRALGWVTLALVLVLAVPATPVGAQIAGPADGLTVPARLAGVIDTMPAASVAVSALAQDPPCETAYRARRFDVATVPWGELFPHQGISPLATRDPHDADGVPMVRAADGQLYYSPSGLTFDALRRLDAWVATDNDVYLRQVERDAARIRLIAQRSGDAIWLPFPYDQAGQNMRAPWVNALAQGTALALFSRLHQQFGRAEDLDFARGLRNALADVRDGSGPWVSWIDSDRYLWFEHYPAGKRGKVLNAHLYVIIGLRDFWQEEPTQEARCLLQAAITTMRDRAQRYRNPGTWSWYALRNRAAWRQYHRFHVTELRAVAQASGDPWFDELADLFVQDYWPR